MQYQYVTEKDNYEDLAPGRVLLSQAGMTSFPVRLTSEIFQRCANYFPTNQRLRVYDPCCGGGYLLTVLGFLHGAGIQSLYGSDINADMVSMASDNLRLLTPEGLNIRRDTLHGLRQRLPDSPITIQTWVADALQPSANPASVDLVICDVPYGGVTHWQADANDNPITALLEAQYDVLVAGGIAAVISDKSQKAIYPGYKRLEQETLGKRRFLILQKV
jgi:23S rRNA (guanine2535-N1)-methyltransferase